MLPPGELSFERKVGDTPQYDTDDVSSADRSIGNEYVPELGRSPFPESMFAFLNGTVKEDFGFGAELQSQYAPPFLLDGGVHCAEPLSLDIGGNVVPQIARRGAVAGGVREGERRIE
jgi:hypothetical protein